MMPSKSFISRMDGAAFAESYVAAKLVREGFTVIHHPVTIAASKVEYDAYMGSVDLQVYLNPDVSCVDIQVKSSSGPGLRRHKLGGVLVCSWSSLLRSKSPPWGAGSKSKAIRIPCWYVFLDSEAVIRAIPPDTIVSKAETLDRTRGENYSVAVAESDSVIGYGKLIERLKAQCNG